MEIDFFCGIMWNGAKFCAQIANLFQKDATKQAFCSFNVRIMNKIQIDRLLIKVSQGDNQAFAVLYEATKKGVFAFIFTYLHNYADTEDATMDVFLKVKRNVHTYKHGTNGLAWMLQIAKNHSLTLLSKRKRNGEQILHENVHGQVSPMEATAGIMDAMQKSLTEEEQRIVTMFVLFNYKHREIAHQLGIPVGTVTSKYKRALQKLKNTLEGH